MKYAGADVERASLCVLEVRNSVSNKVRGQLPYNYRQPTVCSPPLFMPLAVPPACYYVSSGGRIFHAPGPVVGGVVGAVVGAAQSPPS